MKTRAKRLLAILGTSAALAAGTTFVTSGTALAYDCGLTVLAYYDYPPVKRGDYVIKNCHNYAVKRKVEIAGDTDGYCHRIPARSQVHGAMWMWTGAYIRTIKPCD